MSSLFKQLFIDLSLKEKLKLEIFKKVRLFTIFWLVHEVQHEQKQTQKNRKANLSDDGEGVNPPILHRHPYFDILFTLFLSPHLILPMNSSKSGSIKRFRHLNSLYPSGTLSPRTEDVRVDGAPCRENDVLFKLLSYQQST